MYQYKLQLASVPSAEDQETYDVAVLGGGNAALCAALTAREAGARVIVVESAPRATSEGETAATRAIFGACTREPSPASDRLVLRR